MLDIYVSSARMIVDHIKRLLALPVGIFIYAAITGMAGIVILLVFLSMLLSGSTLAWILPAIIAFNAANSGYGLINRGGGNFPRRRTCLIAISILLAVTGGISLIVFSPWESGATGYRYLVFGLSALAFTFFGAWVAVKGKKQN